MVLVADEAVRIERVCSRDSVGKQDVRNRINSQMKDEDKRKKADFIVDNSRGLDELKARLEELIEKLSVVENEIS